MQQGAGRKPYRARLRVDGSFALELQYCNDHGIAHSKFLSWDPVDRAKAMAFVLEKAERCALCGTAPWEWEDDRFAYEPVEHFCRGCYLQEVASEDTRTHPGQSVVLTPGHTVESAQRHIKAAAKYERRHEQ